MRMLLSIGVALLLTGAAGAVEVVIYDSVPTGFRPAVDAATMLGYDVHAYDDTGIDAWIADVADGADIVVFDCHSNYQDYRNSLQLDAISRFLSDNPGGVATVALWFMGSESGHPLWTQMGVQYCSDIAPDPLPIYSWADHPIWDGLPDPLQQEECGWYTDGARVEPTTGTAIGGFTPDPASCQAGLVIGPECRTAYIGLVGTCGYLDMDSDGRPDWVELYHNIFPWLLSDPSPTETGTWGAIKNLYR